MMSNLLSLLQVIAPETTAAEAAELRACLVAISQEGQHQSSSRQFSLNEWWKWLDDEGYNRETFLAALRLLCVAKISADALSTLMHTCISLGDEPDGLALLLEQLDQLDPELSELLDRLETLAITEEDELHQIAGGASARFKFAAVVGAGTLIYCLWQDRKGQKKMEQLVQSQLEAKAINYDRMIRHAMNQGRADIRIAKSDTSQAANDLIHAANKNPEATLQRLYSANRIVYENAKSLTNYTKKDVEDRVAKLVAEHTLAFIGQSVEQKAISELKSSPAYQQKLKQTVLREQAAARPDLSIDWQVVSQKADKALMSGDWFQQEKVRVLNSQSHVNYRQREEMKVTEVYQKMVQSEINIAKQELSNSDSVFLERRVKYVEGQIITKSNIVINRDIVQMVDDAEAAERAAQRDATAFVEEI